MTTSAFHDAPLTHFAAVHCFSFTDHLLYVARQGMVYLVSTAYTQLHTAFKCIPPGLLYSTVLCTVYCTVYCVLCCTVLYCVVLCCTVLLCCVLCTVYCVLCCTVLYCVVLCCTVLCCCVLYIYLVQPTHNQWRN